MDKYIINKTAPLAMRYDIITRDRAKYQLFQDDEHDQHNHPFSTKAFENHTKLHLIKESEVYESIFLISTIQI